MEADTDENDDFDWEAAAAAIENISLLECRPRLDAKENVLIENSCQNAQNVKPGVGMPLIVHTKLQQKTLLSFVHRSKQQPSSIGRVNQQSLNESELNLDDAVNTDGPHIDLEAAKTWVYPVNVPMRDYQYSIVQTALFTNTLVSLPTGLGKTLIAAVVMYNYFRWFPTGKIVFTAPSRPLVLQQIEACHDSVGIPQEYTIDMTGQMNPSNRKTFWRDKRVFFVTPQVFEKDIQSGSCPMQDLVCLVVDEAHRAMGNYAYCVVIRKLMESSVRLRILALTATPGSKQVTIQSVVDNLRISCLEYRNEDDPDVKQYVHNRKLELLQVPMDSESAKIRDLFLEVLQPLVNRLCGFGVFYSKDAARLVPFEFLTARDKFRQAPPPALDPRQFGEVEACFGVTITLYHMFKLLFSHGIRPAFEMLKEKLQLGPFARLMGRNEKLQEIKLLMQKHVHNGASSPKTTKLLELMADHFESNDPSKTRVIIFTNFRESVKDILEALKILGDIVKAMEFIGQSSGKNSKGQSQKVQQLVLQKFRMGGFNTIVATSIAEEGLDIMEVDLVICFDANISPLRMIQRMGRTGRKRDGRVIVLASEGAEVQGYLKKQAKSKVIGKHMHNGGVHSFNFHTSPRMVPHSIRPESELVELSIAKFIPRVKNKQKVVQMDDPGAADLTPEESLIIRRYIKPHQAASNRWKPSLIAFPHCQLLPTQVHNVKHSERTISMLIDTLQSLHELKTRRKDENQLCEVFGEDGDNLKGTSIQKYGSRSTCLQKEALRGTDYIKEDCHDANSDVNGISRGNVDSLKSTMGVSFSSSPNNLEDSVSHQCDCQLVADLSDAPETPIPEPFFVEAVGLGPVTAQVTPGANTIEERCTEHSGTDKACVIGVEDSSKVSVDLCQFDISNSAAKQVPPSPPLDAHPDSAPSHENDSLTCADKFKPLASASGKSISSQGIVSISALGYVQVASPPLLPLGCSFLQQLDSEANSTYHSFLSISRELSTAKFQKGLNISEDKENADPIFDKTPADKVHFESSTPGPKAGCFVASTPEEKLCSRSPEDGIDEDSPRLCTLAEQGLVPSSPGLESNSSQPIVKLNDGIKCLRKSLNIINSSPLRQENTQPSCGLALPSAFAAKSDDTVINGENESENQTTDDVDLTRALSAIKVSNRRKDIETISENLRTPLPQPSDGSNWNQPLEAPCSAQKPRKFRRLCKVKETSKQISGEEHPNRCPGRELHLASDQLKDRLGKQKLNFAAALLVDEEAEVSSDEDVSADEDDTDDEQGSLQDFINDQVEPTVGNSQGSGEPVDMMAVYRKSLLTQSPLDDCALPWVRRLLQTRTPSSGAFSIRSESIISVSSDSHGKVESVSGRDSISINRELQVTPSTSHHLLTVGNSHARESAGFKSSQGNNVLGQLHSTMHSTTKAHERKRKLSFQQEQTLAGCNMPGLSGHFDEDLFAGLDLDALEVEAVQKSRSHLQGASATQPDAATGFVEMQAGQENANLRTSHEEDWEIFPSFNLGIDC